MLGAAVLAWGAGLIRDASGTYALAFLIAGWLALAAGVARAPDPAAEPDRRARPGHAGTRMTEKPKKKGSMGQSIGGVLFGFEQQVFRNQPPPHELVHKARPDQPVPAGDGEFFTIELPTAPDPVLASGAMPDPTDAGPPQRDRRTLPAGFPADRPRPPVVAESADPFTMLRVLDGLARMERGAPVRVDALVDRLNAANLDWLFTRRVVDGRAGRAPGELDGGLPERVGDRARGRRCAAPRSRSRTRRGSIRGWSSRPSARSTPAARPSTPSPGATTRSPRAERASRGRAAPAPEVALSAPVKALLEAQGYDVKGEVTGCDLVGVRGDEPPVIVELKRTFSLALVHQGIDRLALTDAVYLAVGAWPARPARGPAAVPAVGAGADRGHGRPGGRARGPGAVPAAQERAPGRHGCCGSTSDGSATRCRAARPASRS